MERGGLRGSKYNENKIQAPVTRDCREVCAGNQRPQWTVALEEEEEEEEKNNNNKKKKKNNNNNNNNNKIHVTYFNTYYIFHLCMNVEKSVMRNELLKVS
jgi:hypothetical protein